MIVGEEKSKGASEKLRKTKRDSLLQTRHWQHAKSYCSQLTLEHTHQQCGRGRTEITPKSISFSPPFIMHGSVAYQGPEYMICLAACSPSQPQNYSQFRGITYTHFVSQSKNDFHKLTGESLCFLIMLRPQVCNYQSCTKD